MLRVALVGQLSEQMVINLAERYSAIAVRAFQRNGAIFLIARPPLLGQGGESAFRSIHQNTRKCLHRTKRVSSPRVPILPSIGVPYGHPMESICISPAIAAAR